MHDRVWYGNLQKPLGGFSVCVCVCAQFRSCARSRTTSALPKCKLCHDSLAPKRSCSFVCRTRSPDRLEAPDLAVGVLHHQRLRLSYLFLDALYCGEGSLQSLVQGCLLRYTQHPGASTIAAIADTIVCTGVFVIVKRCRAKAS